MSQLDHFPMPVLCNVVKTLEMSSASVRGRSWWPQRWTSTVWIFMTRICARRIYRTSSTYKQECVPVGCIPSAAEAVEEGVSTRGRVSAQGGCLTQCTLGYTPPPLWTEFLTHACENGNHHHVLIKRIKGFLNAAVPWKKTKKVVSHWILLFECYFLQRHFEREILDPPLIDRTTMHAHTHARRHTHITTLTQTHTHIHPHTRKSYTFMNILPS